MDTQSGNGKSGADRGWRLPARRIPDQSFLPQTRHSAGWSDPETLGFLRLTSDSVFVAKSDDFAALRKTNVG
jgi:hypothetical protein